MPAENPTSTETTHDAPEISLPALPVAVPLPWYWVAAEAAVVGSAHLRSHPPKPCQDAALADAMTRPMALVADGAGSALLSHLGAHAVVRSIRRLIHTLEPVVAASLDEANVPRERPQALADQLVAHAIGTLTDLAEEHQRPVEDFRCTLLLWIMGRERAFWLKVGDGALIAATAGQLTTVGPAGKGEFANQTCFIGPRLSAGEWRWGGIASSALTGVAAMSDGAAERLVGQADARVAPAMAALIEGMSHDKIGRRDLFDLLADPARWQRTSGDDKSLSILARRLS